MSTVKSEELKSTTKADQVNAVAESLPWRAVGLIAIVIGSVFWLIGARYTVFGAPLVIAQLLGLFTIVAPITLPTGWPLLTVTVIVGSIVSLIEFGARPRRAFFATSLLLGAVLFFLWLLVNLGDVASTAAAVLLPGPSAGAVARWVAITPWASAPWVCFLTWMPELCMIAGWRWLIRGRF